MPPFFQHQHGFIGRVLGGWTLALIIDIGSGLPLAVEPGSFFAGAELYGGGQTFGEADGTNIGALENAINIWS